MAFAIYIYLLLGWYVDSFVYTLKTNINNLKIKIKKMMMIMKTLIIKITDMFILFVYFIVIIVNESISSLKFIYNNISFLFNKFVYFIVNIINKLISSLKFIYSKVSFFKNNNNY
ncbi:hypothetical protein, partial [Neobacillus notoginsengisoli]|uniref:hypothetical protein n=1 Tax=Neobacillus notoginsengisoli TaxID=1578198 RepID=UPI0019566F21